MEAFISAFCRSLAVFCNHVQSSSQALSDSIHRRPIPLGILSLLAFDLDPFSVYLMYSRFQIQRLPPSCNPLIVASPPLPMTSTSLSPWPLAPSRLRSFWGTATRSIRLIKDIFPISRSAWSALAMSLVMPPETSVPFLVALCFDLYLNCWDFVRDRDGWWGWWAPLP